MGLHVGCKELGLQRVGHDLLTEQQQICTFTSFALWSRLCLKLWYCVHGGSLFFFFCIALIFKKYFIFILTVEFFGFAFTFAPEVGASCASPSRWPWRKQDLSVSSQEDQVLCNRHTRPAWGDQQCLLRVYDVRAESWGQKEWTQERKGIPGGEKSRCKSRMFGGDIANRRGQKDPCAMQFLYVS